MVYFILVHIDVNTTADIQRLSYWSNLRAIFAGIYLRVVEAEYVFRLLLWLPWVGSTASERAK